MLITLALLVATAFAGPTPPLAPGQTMRADHLLEIEDQPGTFLVVGESAHGWHVFRAERGRAHEEPRADAPIQRDRIALDLSLSGGRRVLVPRDPHMERQTPYLIHPDRARERLIERAFTRIDLVNLGLDAWVDAAAPVPAPPAAPAAVPEAPVLVLATFPRTPDFKMLADGLQLDLGAVLSTRTAALIVPAARARLVKEKLQGAADSVIVVGEGGQVLRQYARLNVKSELVAAVLARPAAYGREWVDHVSRGERLDEVLWGLKYFGAVINAMASLRERPNYVELEARLVAPLRDHFVRTIRQLSEMGTREALRLVLLTAGFGGAEGLALLDQAELLAPSPSDQWFDWQMERVPEGPAETMFVHQGGVFQELDLTANLVEAPPDGRMPPNRRPEALPFWRFGVTPNLRPLQKRLIDFVIAADQRMARVLPRLNAGVTPPFDGSLAIKDVLKRLAYVHESFRQVPDFRDELYYGNVIDVVIELLEDAEHVLATRGTYLALLDLSLLLERESAHVPTLDVKRAELARVVRRRLLRVLPALQLRGPACAELLGPDPYGQRPRL